MTTRDFPFWKRPSPARAHRCQPIISRPPAENVGGPTDPASQSGEPLHVATFHHPSHSIRTSYTPTLRGQTESQNRIDRTIREQHGTEGIKPRLYNTAAPLSTPNSTVESVSICLEKKEGRKKPFPNHLLPTVLLRSPYLTSFLLQLSSYISLDCPLHSSLSSHPLSLTQHYTTHQRWDLSLYPPLCRPNRLMCAPRPPIPPRRSILPTPRSIATTGTSMSTGSTFSSSWVSPCTAASRPSSCPCNSRPPSGPSSITFAPV